MKAVVVFEVALDPRFSPVLLKAIVADAVRQALRHKDGILWSTNETFSISVRIEE